MLVLSRKSGETLRIGDDVEITIVASRRGRVQVGISAPKEVRVVRGELEAKEQENHGEV